MGRGFSLKSMGWVNHNARAGPVRNPACSLVRLKHLPSRSQCERAEGPLTAQQGDTVTRHDALGDAVT